MSKGDLFSAARDGDLDRIKTQIDDNNVTNMDKDGNNVLHIAVSADRFYVAEYLLKTFPDEDLANEQTENGGYTPLHLAKNQKMYDLLISYGAEPIENNIGKMPDLYRSDEESNIKIDHKDKEVGSGVLLKPTYVTKLQIPKIDISDRGVGF